MAVDRSSYPDSEVYSISHGSRTKDNVELFDFIESNYDKLPLYDLLNRGLIKDKSIPSIYSFYSTFCNSHNLFRKSDASDEIASDLWAKSIYSRAIQEFASSNIPVFDSNNLSKQFLQGMISKSINPSSIVDIKSNLKKIGIVLVYETAFKGSKSDGVVGKLGNGTPYIGLSLRYKRLDYYWFTLLHEIGHIYNHFDFIDEPIYEDFENIPLTEIEMEANRFALDSLIPRYIWNRSRLKQNVASDSEVVAFAKKANIHPAIVAGRLRNEKNNYKLYNSIVNEVDVRDILKGQL